MKQAGHIALTPFPHTNLRGTKLRPVLLLRKASQRFDDWLVCMISSQVGLYEANLDELLLPEQTDFAASGLKVPSVLRLSRLAVLDGALLAGSIGKLGASRLDLLRRRLGKWLTEDHATIR